MKIRVIAMRTVREMGRRKSKTEVTEIIKIFNIELLKKIILYIIN